MAFEVKKIDPLDLQPRKAVGLKLPFSGKSVFNVNYTTEEAIKTNLIHYFLTGRGERFLNVEFGNGLQRLIFDQLTEDKVREIDATVKADLSFYFPRVEPLSIETVGIPDNNTVQFSMRYKVKNTNIEDEVVINFEQ
jgi:phage baseplate assembly protein W